MAYSLSLLAVVLATGVLLMVVLRLSGSARRLAETSRLCRAYLTDRIGMLTARIAGLKAELNRRVHRHAGSSDGPPAA